jgi:LPS-assembly protein
MWRKWIVCGISSLVLAAPVYGQHVCDPDVISRPRPSATVGEGGVIPIEMEGDEVQSVGQDTITMRGNAQLIRGSEAVFGENLSYSRSTDQLDAEGKVTVYSKDGDKLEADKVNMEVETHIGEAENVEYRIARRNIQHSDPQKAYIRARGTAEKVYLEGHDVTRLQNVTYTTCQEKKEDVVVSASELTIDQGTGRGTAKHIKVRFKNVPIFYAPVLSFPINDDRKTGFLFPSFGFEEKSGFVLQTPYYINLAPNYDATLYPRVYAKRGVQLGGQFRYLTRKSDGFVYGEYMPQDKELDDKDRGAFTYEHRQDFSSKWEGDIDLNWVSDDEYFDDFSNDIQISSATHLPQVANLSYSGNIWRVDGSVRAYQTIDDTIPTSSEPYDRLPRVRALGVWPQHTYWARFRFDSELHNFRHDENLEGWRLDVTPSVERRFEKMWGFSKPKVSFRSINYQLDNVAPGENDTPSVGLPILSWDNGLFFERLSTWQDRPFINTLEPRIFYVYIPEENQDDLPVFDTGEINLNNFNNIYREQRFFGRDRVGDTNQVTLGLVSRFLDAETGRQWMRGSIGQIFFLEDREVQLDDDAPATETESDFLAEVQADFTERWGVYGFVQYDHQESNLREAKADLLYSGPRAFVDLEYRFARDNLEQARVHALVPFGQRWTMIFDDRYSFRDDENLEVSLGFEYNGCCWKTRLFGQRRRRSDSTFRDSIIFEFELTGLATVRTGI